MRGNFFPRLNYAWHLNAALRPNSKAHTQCQCRIKRKKKCKLCFISSHFSCSFNLYVKETQAVCSHSAGSRLGCNDDKNDAENRRLDWADLSAALGPARELYFALLYTLFSLNFFLPFERPTFVRSGHTCLLSLYISLSLLSERMIELYSVVLMDFSFHSLNWLMVIIMNRLGFECKHQQLPDFNSNIDFSSDSST